MASIDSATITLDLTPGDALVSTDVVLFADNNSPRVGPSAREYGNAAFANLTVGERQSVTLNLISMPGLAGTGLTYDLSHLLLDGTLDVVYADDAIVHSARLYISGEPGTVAVESNAWGTLKRNYR